VNYQWKGLQTSTRVMSQSDILPYIVQSGNFTPEYLTSWLTAYAQSVECIRANYYSDSNILISQAQAVATAGMLMPEFKNAETWRKEGCDKLSAQLDAQFLADGVQYELDPSYHIAAISDFREIYELASANSYLSLLPTVFLDKLRGQPNSLWI
jgi:heparan-sulfate lyase